MKQQRKATLVTHQKKYGKNRYHSLIFYPTKYGWQITDANSPLGYILLNTEGRILASAIKQYASDYAEKGDQFYVAKLSYTA